MLLFSQQLMNSNQIEPMDNNSGYLTTTNTGVLFQPYLQPSLQARWAFFRTSQD